MIEAMKPVHRHWTAGDIVGGNSALDLVNTVSGWSADPEDWVPDIASFLVWARTCSLVDPGGQSAAVRRAKESPAAAERVLASVKELRFALWRIVSSLQRGKAADTSDLAVIDEWRRRLALSEEVTAQRNKIYVAIKGEVSALELPGLRVIRAALDLLREFPVGRVKTCPAHDCGWKFVDQSKNRSRRWCDMEVCGNLAKTRRYRSRNR